MHHLRFLVVAATLNCSATGTTDREKYFQITVVDEGTGRGVPLVELRTTNELRFYTDSNGIIAINEPGFFGQEIYFHVSSHGYEFPADGFGYRGKSLKVTAGSKVELHLKRINVAERMYRTTGEGIYRDSILVSHPVPIEQAVLNGQVMGQDSVLATVYRGKLFWFWGDTNQASYPLGNFGTAGATSDLPAPRGHGLDPALGVNLKYFVNDSGFSRPIIPSNAVPGPGPKWIGGVTTIRDERGNERLIAKYVRVKDLGETLERGLVLFNDKTESFERIVQFDLDAPLYLDGHPFRVMARDSAYIYCGYTVPNAIRVHDDLADLTNPEHYEGFSPLAPGTRYDKIATKLDRTEDGHLKYGWKRNTPPLSHEQQDELIKLGKMKRDEAWLTLEDVETGASIQPHAGSVRWNEYRNKWVMIVQQSLGSSNLGEIWYAESDTPIGPWVYARKVVTHDKYSFYNPVHHDFFDQDHGRQIYFEGTYSDLFAGSPLRTPRYDYNQIMYRLALDDKRLFLPAPVYTVRQNGEPTRYLMRDGIEKDKAWNEVDRIAFFAMPPNRPIEGLIPIYRSSLEPRLFWLTKTPPKDPINVEPVFYAVPNDAPSVTSTSIVPLYEYYDKRHSVRFGERFYSTNPNIPDATLLRSRQPICGVWKNPTSAPIFDRGIRASEATAR